MEQLYLRSSDIEKQRKYLQKFKQLMDDTNTDVDRKTWKNSHPNLPLIIES